MVVSPDWFVTEMKTAFLKAAICVARFLAPLPDWEKNLGADSEDIGIRKWLQERGQERGIHDHVVVQKNHDVVPGRCHSTIVAFSEPEVTIQLQSPYAGKVLANPFNAVVSASIVNHQNLVVSAIRFDCPDDGRQTLFEEFTAIPIEDHDRASIMGGISQRKGTPNGSHTERNKLSQCSRDQQQELDRQEHEPDQESTKHFASLEKTDQPQRGEPCGPRRPSLQ